MGGATFDVSAAIERDKLGRFGIQLVLISWLVTFFDGYDMNVIAFTAKRLEANFHFGHDKFGIVTSVGIFGTLLGSVLFGYFGDRLGRRPAIIAATASFSLLTFALAFANSYPALMALRFLGGLALGGAMPLIWALNIEFSPKRLRATVITLIMLGYGFGVAVAGPISSVLIPRFGWPGVFIFGGIASLFAALLLFLGLPESVRLLALRGRRPDLIAKTLRRMGVDLPGEPATARYVVTDEAAARGSPFKVSMLFAGRLKLLTPLVWAAYFSSSISTFFMTSWGPLILNQMGFGDNGSAFLTFGNSLCSMSGAVALMRFTDRYGAISIAVLPIIAVPLLLVAGLTPMSLTAFLFLSLAISVFLGGSHYGVTSVVGLFYPSHIRANGAGWASAMAKFGSVLGPLVGGFVLASHVPYKATYALLAVCPAAYAVAIVAIGLIERSAGRHDRRAQALASAAAE